jgi:peptidoglycan/LPS O-acetylase OafA/YrhL
VGVTVFFVISGFLLYRPFVRARLRDETAPRTLAYGWRRILRIGPAYWVALTIIGIWLGLAAVHDPDKAPALYLFGQSYSWQTAVSGLPQAWSLCVEAAFYVLLPIYAFSLRSVPLRAPRARFRVELCGIALLVVAGFAFTTLAVTSGATDRLDRYPLQFQLPPYLKDFAVGMCLAVLSVWYEGRGTPRLLRPVERFPGLCWAVALLAFLGATKLSHDGHALPVNGAHYMERAALYLVIGAGIVTPAVFGDQTRGFVRKLLANRVLLWLGLISYSIFLWHVAVQIQVHRWHLPAQAVISLFGTIAIAAVSYYVVERPALRLKRLVGQPSSQPREAIAEPAPVAPPRVSQAG